MCVCVCVYGEDAISLVLFSLGQAAIVNDNPGSRAGAGHWGVGVFFFSL